MNSSSSVNLPNLNRKPYGEITNVFWTCLSREQWRAIAVVNITKPSSKDGGFDEDRNGTPYDSCMGEQRNLTPCGTCGKTNNECPGHFGLIELPFPIYHKKYAHIVLKILQSICPKCARPRMLPEYMAMKGITRYHGLDRVKQIAAKCNTITKKCPWEDCGKTLVKFELPTQKKQQRDTGIIYYSIEYFENDENTKNIKTKKKKKILREEFSALLAFELLSRISNEDIKNLGFNETLLFNNPAYTNPKYLPTEDVGHVHQVRPENMILTVLPVLPPLARPWVIEQEGGERKDDDLTDKYNTIIKNINAWKAFDANGNRMEKAGTRRGNKKTKAEIERDIMENVWTLMDNKSEKSKLPTGTRAHRSLVCRIKGKQGHVQHNVAGKRCDFSARTVIIGGGIFLEDDQFGVPRDIAEIETKRELVGPWNIDELQDIIMQGKVNCVIRAGILNKFSEYPNHGRHFKLRICDVIERQLRDGDVILINRQPTLKTEGMMAFHVKIIEGLAFRLPLWATKAFNAD